MLLINSIANMKVVLGENTDYDSGIHPMVSELELPRTFPEDFFRGNRFPNLVCLNCSDSLQEQPDDQAGIELSSSQKIMVP